MGKLALNSSVAMLAICIAFAAPLLTFTDRTSFAICLFGRSRSGKTLASLCAASLVGIRSVDDLVGWRSTDNAIEERLSDFMDILFVLDDISAMDANEREQYNRLRNFAYMLATNQGKGRARSYKGSVGLDHGRHRTIVLTSAETSIASLAQRAGRTRLSGEELRLIDLPAANENHIFDRMPATIGEAQAAEWRSQTYANIVKACGHYHGTAFQFYVSRLIRRRSSLAVTVSSLITKFVQHLGGAASGPEANDLAQRFGLLYAGGIMGVELKCVPWTQTDVLEAVTTCYRRARDLLSDDERLLASGLRILEAGMQELPMHLPARETKLRFGKIDGYKEKSDDGSICIVIKTDALNRLLPNNQQRDIIKHWLLKHRAIAVAQNRSSGRSSGARPIIQLTWPDGKRRRSVRISLTNVIKARTRVSSAS